MNIAVSDPVSPLQATDLLPAGMISRLVRNTDRARAMEIDLKSLFREISIRAFHGRWNTIVRDLCIDSRKVTSGSVFFALEGARSDGNYFIEEAVDKGAVCVVSSRRGRAVGSVAYVEVEDVRGVMAAVARQFYGQPEQYLELIGITGTNGKSTVAALTKSLFEYGGHHVGMLGTIGHNLGLRTLPADRTTPESIDIYRMLAEVRNLGLKSVVMEVTSIGIHQKRVVGLDFDVAVFLNLTQDHIDYHRTMDEYFEVKSRIFTGESSARPKVAVINCDDEYGKRLLRSLPSDVASITFGLQPAADLRAANVALDATGSTFTVYSLQGELNLRTPLLGKFNIYNTLAALAIAQATGRDLEQAVKTISRFSGVPGRMEMIAEGQPFSVVVDYAHTEDALRNALDALRPITPGRLLVVFGCGGNRDVEKRPLMTRIVVNQADWSWATADNPRREPLRSIFDDMRRGLAGSERITFVEDRRLAIERALDFAEAGDCVLIVGKGHETTQEFSNSIVPFDDRRVAREILLSQAASVSET